MSVLHLGPLPIHIYALCIVAGIVVAVTLSDRRWQARGGAEHEVGDVAGWAVLFGIAGGRIYHVLTDPELYFTAGRHPIDAFKIWDGGLGIWGAVALGALGAYIGCRRHQLNFGAFADTVAPGIVLAQGIGRLGNWFNNELYGRATTVPWKLQIHDLDTITGKVATDAAGRPLVIGFFHPTFLYELVWDFAVAGLILYADRRLRLGRGNVFALYVMGYTTGRFWIESLRSDKANHLLGMRVNSWVSILVFVGGLAWFMRHRHDERSSARPDLKAIPEAGDPSKEVDPIPESGHQAGGPDAVRPVDSSHGQQPGEDDETAGRPEPSDR